MFLFFGFPNAVVVLHAFVFCFQLRFALLQPVNWYLISGYQVTIYWYVVIGTQVPVTSYLVTDN